MTKFDLRALALAERHYPRQRKGARQFMPPGRTLVLLSEAGDVVWGACLNLSPRRRELRWRVTIFRNESARLSSELVRELTSLTFQVWLSKYGALPAVPLTTEVDPARVRRKRDPGRCFRRAGWSVVPRPKKRRHATGGVPLVVLAAPSSPQ